jgi:molecular chaperone GrpE
MVKKTQFEANEQVTATAINREVAEAPTEVTDLAFDAEREKSAQNEAQEEIAEPNRGNEVVTEPPNVDVEIKSLQSELEETRAKAEEHWNKLLRVQAELENQRKRSARDLENAHKYAIDKFALELLPVKDSLELGLGHSSDQVDADKLHEGMALTLKMFAQVLEKFSIKEVDPQGEPFNPELHQAMTTQDNSELPVNTVITVMQKGYTLNDRLLRPAMVIVSKKP